MIFIGDGAFGEGTIYETLNLIKLWNIPILIVVENNSYAQTTPISLNFSGSFIGRVKGFDVSVGEIETNDVEILHQRFAPVVAKVRSTQSPHVEIIHTYRLGPHSKGDDDRSKEEIDKWREKDPLTILEKRVDDGQIKEVEGRIFDLLAKAEKEARKMPFPTLV